MAEQRGKEPRHWSLGDAYVGDAVAARLASDRLIDARRIGVSSRAGVVTLSGAVPGASDIAHAELLAHQAPGVMRVVNQLRLEPGPRAVDSLGHKALDREQPRWVPPFIT